MAEYDVPLQAAATMVEAIMAEAIMAEAIMAEETTVEVIFFNLKK